MAQTRLFTLDEPGSLPWIPRFVIESRSVFVAPYTGSDAYDQHIARTVGSGGTYGFDEAIRFDRTSRQLVSVWVRIPENPQPPSRELEQLMLKTPTPCVPRLNADGFRLEGADSFSIESSAKWIAATYGAFSPDQERVRVAQDFELIFDETIVGWVLHNPAQYLWEDWTGPHSTDTPMGLEPVLVTFLRLINRSFVERLDDGDASALQELRTLRYQVDTLPDSQQARAVSIAIERILETFS